jgi:hypothetical protein
MSLNFNVDPYYDDFDQTKNFHRILFRPGRAVQARELTQAQTILQDQVTKFADNIFKQNSPVTGGQVTTNFNCYYIKLQATYNNAAIDITQFDGLLVKNATGTVVARVIAYAAATGTDPATLVVSYKSGLQFENGDVIYDSVSNLAAQAILTGATGYSSVASINQGVFYILGNFVQISASTIILEKYNNSPTKRVGLTITETIYDYINDSSLLDPAIGASNYQAPGADRYVISLALDTRPIALGDDDNFIELIRVTSGVVANLVEGSVYNVIDDYFAKRDYETNGDYIVEDYKLTPRTTPVAVDPSANTYTLTVGKGLAYVHGYRIQNATNVDLVSDRARTTDSQDNTPVFIDYGSYFYVDTVRGGASGTFFDVTTAQAIDLHCVTSSNIITTNTATYNSTVVGTGYIRNFVYEYNTNDADANTYVYKAFVNDIQNAVLSANVTTATTNTITFAGTYSQSNTSYVGVNISITKGTSAGDFRTITSYDGVTRIATVNQNWTVTPDATSVYQLNFDIKDIDTIVYADKTSYPAVIKGYANINATGRTGGVSTGETILENPNVPELVYNIGSPYVASLSSTSYNTQQLNRGVSFTVAASAATATINYSGDYAGVIKHLGSVGSLSSDVIKQNWMIVVTNKGSSSLNVGEIIPWTSKSGTITLSSDLATATLSIPVANVTSGFTATVFEKVYASNADNTSHLLKYKNLISANTQQVKTNGTQVATYTFVDDTSLTSTGQIYIQNAGLVSPGSQQSLYLSDVKSIVKIIDTKASGTVPILSMLTNPAYDVTTNYTFDNGQRDSYYDHASITLRPGANQPQGNILVLVNYYQHTGGDGYFALTSYLNSTIPDTYQTIPSYTSKHGKLYPLRDSVDFRPARDNATATFSFRYNIAGDNRQGVFIPTDLSTFTTNYEYYLGRKDKLILTKDRSFKIIEGAPSVNPLAPSEPDGSLVIANLTHRPYTGYIPTEAPSGTIGDLSIDKVKHKRYTMQDIAGLENRINNIEYYTSLNLLEQKATSLQISDAYGLNRFKNGILVDDFSSFGTGDTFNNDFNTTINRRDRVMTASQVVQNFPLKSLATAYNMGNIDFSGDTVSSGGVVTKGSSLGYAINTDGNTNYFTLPYATANVISQKFASRTVNVNPFSFGVRDGYISLSPNVDTWVDTNYSPALLVVDPNLQVFQASQNINQMTNGDWKTIPGTQYTTTKYVEGHGINPSPYGYVGYKETSTYGSQAQTNTFGAFDKVGTYALNNNYVTDVSILPWMRPQQIVSRAKGMLFNTSVNYFFDGTNVNNYIRKGNIIELTGVTGTFKENDIIGYYASGSFRPTARVLGVYVGTSSTRLYVAADQHSATYTTNGTIQNGFFNSSGTYTSTTASGTVSRSTHFAGRIINAANTTTIQLSPLASSANSYYNSNTFYVCAGTGVGQSANIASYNGVTKTITLSTAVTSANDDIYSIGSFSTDESGSTYGVFNLPKNTFHNGQRTLRVDNRINDNIGTETTYAEGIYYAEGLQTTAQTIDYSSSPSSAKGTFTSTQYRYNVLIADQYEPWDPVAQTFIVDKTNFPNGMFLNSISVFFASKPTTDGSPVKLYIVGTQNGYPDGNTLDHSVVSLAPSEVNVSTTPQYLDSTATTKFTFSAPVYIQPGVLYAFILKSNSNQYTMWTASNGDTALSSSVKNLPSDPLPSTITKISGAPYTGGLFTSQNSQTWTADQNQSLMFVADRCVFTQSTPSIQFVVPNKLPQRTLIDQSINYYLNANNLSGSTETISTTDVYTDAFNITTTDFIPTSTSIGYSYNATLVGGTASGATYVNPGKFGTPTNDDIYLADGKGERVLYANSNTSFSLYGALSTIDNAVSPMISDAGLSVYSIKWNINNAELSNSVITLTSGGTGYNANTTSVTISSPTGSGGSQAYAAANVANGVIQSIYLTSNGSGYITTPTVTIIDANNTPGTGATAIITGETSKNGGNITAKYVTKKVVLDASLDSGDMNVYLTAYRPVNTDILVYYKILNRNDTQRFDDGSWQLMTMINNSGSLYSQTRSDTYEYVFAPGDSGVDQGYVSYTSITGQTYTSFSQFAIKVVLISSDHTYTPFANDLRVIALPSNVNTTV